MILCTFPGKFGDLLWALPSMRALARRLDAPVDLLIAAPFASICPLLEAQPYIDRCRADAGWAVRDTAPMTPRIPPNREDVISPYRQVYHLGYRYWPRRPLPFETLDCLNEDWTIPFSDADLALDDPWIQVEGTGPPCEIAVGFTEEHFELKYGIMTCLERRLEDQLPRLLLTPPGSRWTRETLPGTVSIEATDWIGNARAIRNSDLFFGDCSALHVLACAMGRRVILMEPADARHHPIFYPFGWDGPQVRMVKGNDGLPTFDARHCGEALERALGRGQGE